MSKKAKIHTINILLPVILFFFLVQEQVIIIGAGDYNTACSKSHIITFIAASCSFLVDTFFLVSWHTLSLNAVIFHNAKFLKKSILKICNIQWYLSFWTCWIQLELVA